MTVLSVPEHANSWTPSLCVGVPTCHSLTVLHTVLRQEMDMYTVKTSKGVCKSVLMHLMHIINHASETVQSKVLHYAHRISRSSQSWLLTRNLTGENIPSVPALYLPKETRIGKRQITWQAKPHLDLLLYTAPVCSTESLHTFLYHSLIS